MKQGIHPDYKPVTITCVCGNTIETGSVKKDIRVEICSNCHPFYAGTQKIVDTEGRVDRFKKRYKDVDTQALSAKKLKEQKRAQEEAQRLAAEAAKEQEKREAARKAKKEAKLKAKTRAQAAEEMKQQAEERQKAKIEETQAAQQEQPAEAKTEEPQQETKEQESSEAQS